MRHILIYPKKAVAETSTESLLEELIELQSTSPTFRNAFKSQQTTGVLINAYAGFVSNGRLARSSQRNYVRILGKMNHFILALTLDNSVGSAQKREVCSVPALVYLFNLVYGVSRC